MTRLLSTVAVLAAGVLGTATAEAGHWMFRPSYFSHDPHTGHRLGQFAQTPPVYAPPSYNYSQSAYRFNNLTIKGAGGSRDRQLYTESWGNGSGLRDAQAEREFEAWQRAQIIRRPNFGSPWFGAPGYRARGNGYRNRDFGYPEHFDYSNGD